MKRSHSFWVFLSAAVFLTSAISPAQDPARVSSHRKISDTLGGFTGGLQDLDSFGESVAFLGDLDGDGIGDIAVGARADDGGGSFDGAVWVLFLRADGSVRAHQKINEIEGGFSGVLDDSGFGWSLASLGDFDGDGVVDLAVGAVWDSDVGVGRGAIWILFLETDGTVKAHQKIDDTHGGFTGFLEDNGSFGSSLASLGDLDGDGVGDLAVGAIRDGFSDVGAVWILFLNADGTVKGHQKINDTQGGFTGQLDALAQFGQSLGALGDLDGDGIGDLAVGNPGDYPPGAVWILFLNSDGTVKSHQKINDVEGGFAGKLYPCESFGFGLNPLADLDGDGIGELAVGAVGDEDGGSHLGAVWILFLDSAGTVKVQRKISATRGGFEGQLDTLDFFGRSVTSVGDLDGDGIGDLAVGASRDDDGGTDRGAVWILFMGNSLRSDHRSLFTDTVQPGGTLVLGSGPLPPAPSFVVLGTRLRTTRRDLAAAWDSRVDPRSIFALVPDATSLRLPDDPGLVGRTVYAQRVTFGPLSGTSGVRGAPRFGDVLEIRID